MLLVADKGREDEVFAVFKKWGLDAVTIGRVTGDGMLRVKDHGVVVAEIPNRELADEAPLYDRPHNVAPYRPAPMEAPEIPPSRDLNADLLALVGSGDLCSKRWIWEQYDYMVRTNTIAGRAAMRPSCASKETDTSVAMSLDGNARYCALSPREGVKLMVAECCRNLSTVGATPVAATNNLNFGNPERPEISDLRDRARDPQRRADGRPRRRRRVDVAVGLGADEGRRAVQAARSGVHARHDVGRRRRPAEPDAAGPRRVCRDDQDRAGRYGRVRHARGDRRVRPALAPARRRRARLGPARGGDPAGRDPGHPQAARADVRARREHPRGHDGGEARGAAPGRTRPR